MVSKLRARQCVPEATAQTWCPLCNGILGCQGHHATTCVAGGGRTLRHNAVRDIGCAWAERARLHSEKDLGCSMPRRHSCGPATPCRRLQAPPRQETLVMAARATGATAASQPPVMPHKYGRHPRPYSSLGSWDVSQRASLWILLRPQP